MYRSSFELNNLFYQNNYSFIKDLFFFEMQKSYLCPSCKYNENQFYIKCVLDLDLDQKLNKWKNIEYISIYDFLDLYQSIECNKCNYNCLYKRKINTCPKILIIAINSKETQNIKFNLDEEIDISNYLTDKENYYQAKYKLISIIVNNSLVYCRSMERYAWYKYEKTTVKTLNNINNNLNNVPYLLIYEQKSFKPYFTNNNNNYIDSYLRVKCNNK